MTEVAAPPRPRRRRWLRRLLFWTVAVLLLLRVAIWIALPFAVKSVLAGVGFAARWERLDLSLLAGTVELSQLELSANTKDGTPAPADARLEYLSADLDVLALLRGTVRVRRVEIDGVIATLRRNQAGRLRLCGLDLGGDGTVPPPAPAPAERQPLWDFTPPVQVLALRLQDAAISLRDDADPDDQLGCHLQVSLRVSDFGVPDRDTLLDLDVHAPGTLDALRMGGHGRLQGTRGVFDLSVMVRGLHPGRLATWIEPIGLRQAAEQIDLDLRVHADSAPIDASNRLSVANALVTGLNVRADGVEAAAVDRLQARLRQVQVAQAAQAALALEVELDGVRAHAEKLAGGGTRMFGLDFLPSAGAVAEAPAPAPAPSGPALAFAATVRNVVATLRDQTLGTDAVPLELQLTELTLPHAASGEPQPFTLRLHAPGVVEQLSLAGTAQPTGARRTATFRIEAEGITMARLQPLLERAGLAAEIEHANLHCRGSLEATAAQGGGTDLRASFGDLVLRDRDELLRWPGIEVEATAGRPGDVALDIGRIAVRGPELRARIDKSGSLHFLGLRTTTPAPGPAPEPSAPADHAPLPRFRLGVFTWNGLALRLYDERHEPPAELAVAQVALQLADVSDAPGAAAGRFELRAVPEGIASELRVSGTVGSQPGPALTLQLQCAIDGVTLQALRPWLEPAGVRSELRDGRLTFALDAAMEHAAAASPIRVELRDLDLRDGDRPLFALAGVRAEGITFGSGVQVRELAIRDPHLAIEQLADGTLLALGLAFPPAASVAPAPSAEAPPAPEPSGPSDFRLGHLELSGLTFDLRQAGDAGPHSTRLTASAVVDRIRVGDAEPTTFRVEASAVGMLEQLEIEGRLRLGHADLDATGRLRAKGIQPSGLRRFLPATMEPAVARADFDCAFTVELGGAEGGGQRVAAELSSLALAGDDGTALLTSDAVRVRIDRLDPAQRVLHVAEAKVLGVKLDVKKDAAGAMELLGMRLLAGRAAEEPRAPAVAVEAGARTATTKSAEHSDRIGDCRIDQFELEIAELRVRDAAAAGAGPAHLTLRLRAMAPLQLIGPEPDQLPPLHLLAEGTLEPLAQTVRLDLSALPFATAPELRADFAAGGLQLAAFERLFPGLAGRLRDDGGVGGALTAQLLFHAQSREAGSGAFDWSRDFRAEAELSDLWLRAAGRDEILAGVDSVRVEMSRISPATGDVEVRTVEVLTPRLHARQTAEGLHVLGLLVLPPAGPEPVPPEPEHPTAEPAETPQPRAPTGGNVSIASILVQGIDFDWRDETATPPTEVPLDALDFEITGFSTRAFTRPETIRFRGSLGAGAVDLPRREQSGLIGGILGAATGVIGARKERPTERRTLLDEIAVNGKLSLAPSFHLETTVNVNQFELTGLRGAASSGGVEIEEGTFSAGIHATLDQSAGFSTDSTLVFRDLSIREPAHGPVSSYLHLPMGLDAVLFALRDENGEQHIPLNFRVGRQGMSTDRIVGMAVAKLSELLTRAVYSSPFRVLGTVTSVTGIGGHGVATGAEAVQAIAFAPASTNVPPATATALDALAAEAVADPHLVLVLAHHLGSSDLAIAAQLGNPPAAEVRAIVQGLRQRREALLVRRATELQAVRVQAGIEGFEHPRLREGLRAIDTELGNVERALDRGLELMTPSAERRTDARSRKAALAVANQRLEAVRQALIERGIPSARIEVRRPQLATGERSDGAVYVTPRLRVVQ